jgi:hypothetical protein
MLGAEALFAVMRVTTRFGARNLAWQEVAMGRFLGGALVVAVMVCGAGAFVSGVAFRGSAATLREQLHRFRAETQSTGDAELTAVCDAANT